MRRAASSNSLSRANGLESKQRTAFATSDVLEQNLGRPGDPFYHNPDDHHDEIGDPRFTDPETGHIFQNQQDLILWELLQGNRKYVKWLQNHMQRRVDSGGDVLSHNGHADLGDLGALSTAQLKQVGYLQQIEEERLGVGGGPLRPTRPKALTIACARSFAPMDHIFGTDARALMSVRVAGYTCSAADSVIGSVEFALAEKAPPVLIVVGNARNDIVSTAVRSVIASRGLNIAVPVVRAQPYVMAHASALHAALSVRVER